MPPSPEHRPRKTRASGRRSRQAIVQAAVELASVEGLAGLSIGTLAERLGMSKSGLYAHFGSKEDLELAVVEHAGRVFTAEVIRPSESAPAGVARLVAHCEAYLSYLERRVFPGGCFFARTAAETAGLPTAVRDGLDGFQAGVAVLLEAHIRDAQRLGELPADLDVEQLVFEVMAALAAATAGWPAGGSGESRARVRTAVERLVRGAASGV